MVDAGLKPREAYPGVNNRWRCLCLICGAKVWARLNAVLLRAKGRRGCKVGYALDPLAAATVMLAAALEPLTEFPGAGKP